MNRLIIQNHKLLIRVEGFINRAHGVHGLSFRAHGSEFVVFCAFGLLFPVSRL